MSRSTISTFQLFEMFPDQETARLYLESRLWPEGVRCPYCRSDRVTTRKGGYYRCNACVEGHNFTVRTNTIFERSHVPLHKTVVRLAETLVPGRGWSRRTRLTPPALSSRVRPRSAAQAPTARIAAKVRSERHPVQPDLPRRRLPWMLDRRKRRAGDGLLVSPMSPARAKPA